MAKQTLPAIKSAVAALSLADIRDLQAYITDLMLERMEEEWEPPVNENTVETVKTATGCLQLQLVKCGKAGCKCEGGKLHGPYWYSYTRVDGKLKKKYHGKARPAA